MTRHTPSSPMPGRPQWRLFLRALAGELDAVLDIGRRDALLRRVGAQMALGAALPAVSTLDALEAEINAVLADLGWGDARFEMDESSRALRIVHAGLPPIGSIGGPGGPWLSAVLEGLYTAWLGQQPNADPRLMARRAGRRTDGAIALTYGRHEAGDVSDDERPYGDRAYHRDVAQRP